MGWNHFWGPVKNRFKISICKFTKTSHFCINLFKNEKWGFLNKVLPVLFQLLNTYLYIMYVKSQVVVNLKNRNSPSESYTNSTHCDLCPYCAWIKNAEEHPLNQTKCEKNVCITLMMTDEFFNFKFRGSNLLNLIITKGYAF